MFVKGKNVETIEELQVGQAVLNYVISIVHGRDASQKRAEQLKRLSKRAPGKTEMTLVCSACGKGGVQLNKCARCRDPAYCSKECQKEHWKAHKKVCGVAADPYFTVRNNVSSVLPKGVAFTDASASDRALFRRRVRELVELKKTTTAPWPSDMPFQDIMKRWVIPDAVCAFLQRIEAQGPTNPEDEHSGANQPLLQPFYVTVYGQHGSKPFHGGTCTLNACWDGGDYSGAGPGGYKESVARTIKEETTGGNAVLIFGWEHSGRYLLAQCALRHPLDPKKAAARKKKPGQVESLVVRAKIGTDLHLSDKWHVTEQRSPFDLATFGEW